MNHIQLHSFADELQQMKQAGVLSRLAGGAANPTGHLGSELYDVGGLGILAAPVADKLQAMARARLAGESGDEAVSHRQLLSEPVGEAMELGGLGTLAVPGIGNIIKHLKKHGAAAFKAAMAVPGGGGLFGQVVGGVTHAASPAEATAHVLRGAPLPNFGRAAATTAAKVSPSLKAPPPSLAALVGKKAPPGALAKLPPPRPRPAGNMFAQPAVDMSRGYALSPQFMADMARG